MIDINQDYLTIHWLFSVPGSVLSILQVLFDTNNQYIEKTCNFAKG